MPVSNPASNPWQRAATTSVLWRALTPVRSVWMAAETAVARAAATRDSQGPGGAGDSEARAWSIVGSSSLVRVLDGLVLVATAAWRGSVSSAMLRRLSDQLKARSPLERIRLTSGVTSVASATVLAIQRLGSRPAPLTWVVPAIALGVSVCLLVVARERPAR